jgi:PAS domain S-box-containing protein
MAGQKISFLSRILKSPFQNRPGTYSGADKYHTIINQAPDAFLECNISGKILTVNQKACELSEYTEAELLSMNLSSFFSLNTLQKHPLRFDLLDQGLVIKTDREIQTKSGRIIQVETSSCALSAGDYISFVRDITDRLDANRAIRLSEARLTRAELASKSGNWELHMDTNLIAGSLGACHIYGVDETLLDFEVVKTVPLPEYRHLLDKSLEDLIKYGKPYDIEFKIRAIDTGEIKDIHSIAIYDAERRVLFGVIQDITEQKKVEEELRKAKEKAEESHKLKTAFLQNLSHEIRTPMNAIVGFAGLMTDEARDQEKLKQYSSIISHKCDDLLDIISDILEIARIESNQLTINPRECSIPEILNETYLLGIEYRNRLGKSNIHFEVNSNIVPANHSIITDPGKLKQLLMNLVKNAFKFTTEGSVTLTCFKDAEDMLSFSVKDTGKGIPADKHETIFERFLQLDSDKASLISGTGIGLSIVKGLLRCMNGTLQLESEPGRGSTFTFKIPLVLPNGTNLSPYSH